MNTTPARLISTVPVKCFAAVALTLASMQAGSVVFEWDHSPDPLVTHYRLYWGTSSGAYTANRATLTRTNALAVDNSVLASNVPYFFTVTAVNAALAESLPSNEVSWTNVARPRSPAKLRVLESVASSSNPVVNTQ